MKNLYRSTVATILLSVICSTSLIAGGDKFSPRLVGMGRSFTALSRGLDAVGTNPANLALSDRDATVTINLVPIGFQVGSDLFNYKIYNDYFTGIPDPNDPNNRIGKPLNDADKNEILGLFPEGIARTQMKFETAPIGVSVQIGNFGFAIVPSIQTAVNLDLSEGYLKFPLMGTEVEKKYSFNGTALNASAVAEVNTSIGYMLPMDLPNVSEISVGIGIKYLQGLAFIATDHYNASIEIVGETKTYQDKYGNQYQDFVAEDIRGDFEFLQYVAVDSTDYQPVGSGMGFDIGASALLFDAVRVGVSVTDIGSIKWDKYTKAIVGASSFSLKNAATQAGQDTISQAFKGTTKDTSAFEFDLPTAFHFGAEMRVDEVVEVIPFRWTVAVDMHLGLNEVAGNTKLAQFAIGTELDPLAGWLPLRTGILLGGRDRFSWAAGFGIHLANTFDLDFATQSIAILTNPDGFRTGSFTMGMRLRF
ncbi:MAG: hypothetical protein HYV29_04035 [Ignavibacteriales bacterium]|nr:hypothetical protein [Ignavibacteriales bacterium]